MTELDEVECVSCGASIDPGLDRGCVLGDGSALCWSCARKRGGVWDETNDRWVKMPDPVGLPHARP